MGEHSEIRVARADQQRQFTSHILDDLKALEQMLDQDMIEHGPSRIGAEQEFCIIGPDWKPSNTNLEALKAINDPHFTTELARYNIEINLDPIDPSPKSFQILQQELERLMKHGGDKIAEMGNNTLLTGILPTIRKSELMMDHITPIDRYFILNDAMRAARGTDFELHIKGVDELTLKHESVLFEACNTSFQMHLQIDPKEFNEMYNWAQAITGPLLSVCTNSPMLLGRELWSESRIALFQQSIDLRGTSHALQERDPRVTFGKRWITGGILDIFREDLARYVILVTKELDEYSTDSLKNGKFPDLTALRLHNSTIYRWNRACYGVAGDTAHLRIENRYIPSGPSALDEVANTALWIGAMSARPKEFDEKMYKVDFRDVRENFVKSARTGLNSVQMWLGQMIPSRELIKEKFIPMALEGLQNYGIEKGEAKDLMEVVSGRLDTHSGSEWMVRSYRNLCRKYKVDDALTSLTHCMWDNQQSGKAVHEWPVMKIPAGNVAQYEHKRIDQIMSTSVVTVRENDLAEMATSIMEWENIHHLPVEDKDNELVGLVTWRMIDELKEQVTDRSDMRVADIMVTDVLSCSPEENLEKMRALMIRNEIGCLPVVRGKKIVGMVTKKDIIND